MEDLSMLHNRVNRWVKRAASMVAASLLSAPAAMGGDVSVDIRIGAPPPPPPAVVIVREEPVVYETFVVGYRRDLYDADLRLRIARADEWTAHEELAAARRHEGEFAVQLDEAEALVADLRHRLG